MNEKERAVFLRGRKTILRPIDPERDLARCYVWVNDPEVMGVLSHAVRPISKESERKFLEGMAKLDQEHFSFAIETFDGEFIGTMSLMKIDLVNHNAETGTMIGDKRYWGKGYGTDAKMTLLHYAFNYLNLHRVSSGAFSFNKRSINYSLRCGYKIEGAERQAILRNGRYYDKIHLGLLRKDWLPLWRRYQKTGSLK